MKILQTPLRKTEKEAPVHHNSNKMFRMSLRLCMSFRMFLFVLYKNGAEHMAP